MGFNLYNHGETRTKSIPVNQGKVNYKRNEKFCCKHGWVDLFQIGGELEWHRQHSKCDQQVEAGAALEPVVVLKSLKKAA